MATPKSSSKKLKLEDLPAQEDPRASLDADLLLKAAQPALKALSLDLLARAKGSAAVTAALEARHGQEQAAERTADPYDLWLRVFVEQVAAAWLLSCVFVRVLEDRGLVEQNRLAGPGALDSQQLFFELAPSLSERDYLLMVFRELSELPAAAELFDARHNPVWLLQPSAEGARALLARFRTPTPHAPALRFGQADTRFLGDLYQDLSEDVRKRYALLQTPDFVEQFILDRTLERAIERFGLNETTLIDPTCGSGHFLLGAFERLVEHRLRDEPGLDVRSAAHKALDAVYGADINPYAVAIARFRLTLAFLDKTGYTRLADAPKLPLHLAVADSLLHNPQGKTEHQKGSASQVQMALGEIEGVDRTAFDGAMYALEDEAAARDVLYRRFAAVVGNPPYITVKDKALRDHYRRIYSTCHREYSLAVPFKERFFQLAREGGSVGMITANSFMKREFGKKVIEDFLPSVNLDLIVNTSGAYIPGHGTPTVLLFGTSEAPVGRDVQTVLAKRGEPTTPDDPAQGQVWSSIAGHWSEVGFDNDFITVARTEREMLGKHPWSLGGGGAAELKALLEERAEKTLGAVVDSIGFMAITKQDDVFSQGRGVFERVGVEPSWTRTFVIGEHVRDWAIASDDDVLFPYDDDGELQPLDETSHTFRFLWPYRCVLESRAVFGGQTFKESGRPWYAYGQIPRDRIRGSAITFAFVATHNHFVLDRGGKVFNRSAPIIKLPEGATEDDYLALLAYLNSSTACFWMKQVFHDKGSGTDTGGWQDDPAKARYEFAGTQMGECPLPSLPPDVRTFWASLASRCLEIGVARSRLLADLRASSFSTAQEVSGAVSAASAQDERLLATQIGLQEQIDWSVYSAFQLTEHATVPTLEEGVPLGERPFEIANLRIGLHVGIDGQSLSEARDDNRVVWTNTLIEKIQTVPVLTVLEAPEYKRRWLLTPKDGGGRPMQFVDFARAALLDQAREVIELHIRSALRECGDVPLAWDSLIAGGAKRNRLDVLSEWIETTPRLLVDGDAVPFLAAHRYTDAGLDKRAAWERTWDLQRREDAGETIANIPVPPKYDNKDFRDPNFFRLRGKLDVPKERFISYPGCESDEDGEPVYGWAGWNHLQQAQALAGLYQARKDEGWEAARLTPLLAGILELLPWVKQWHNEPSAEFDGLRLGDYFEGYLDGECATFGLSREVLRAWRPTAKVRGKAPGAKGEDAKPKAARKPRASKGKA